MGRSDVLLAYKESRYAEGKRLDPAGWYQERLRKQLATKLATVRASPVAGGWFEAWYATLVARKVKTGTLYSYLNHLQTFAQDPEKLTTDQIIQRLAELSAEIGSAERYRGLCVVLKTVVKRLRGRDEADKISLPPHGESRKEILSPEDIQKMLEACDNPRDRLIIEFFTEMGDRRGEHNNLKVKDVAFDQHSPIVWLHGKTGERRRRIYVSRPDLVSYLNSHPHRDDPNAAFWWSERTGEPIQYEGLYKIVAKVGQRALHRPIHPHMFRHTSATADAKRFTDREMMIRHGWSSPAQVKVYAHLSMRDVDDKDLIQHGLKPASEAQEPLIEVRHCPKCQAENAPVAIYCQFCNHPLTETDEMKTLNKKVETLQLQVRMLQDASGLKVVQT